MLLRRHNKLNELPVVSQLKIQRVFEICDHWFPFKATCKHTVVNTLLSYRQSDISIGLMSYMDPPDLISSISWGTFTATTVNALLYSPASYLLCPLINVGQCTVDCFTTTTVCSCKQPRSRRAKTVKKQKNNQLTDTTTELINCVIHVMLITDLKCVHFLID